MIDRNRLAELFDRERATFTANHPKSQAAYENASHLFGRVPMTWMNKWSGGYPLYLATAHGNRVTDIEVMPMTVLGRPRVDVVLTISGIFRDLLPLQIRLLAEAAFLAASADEPPELNFVRKHALAYQQEHGCTLEVASLRVYGNAEGAYGSHVNSLI